MRNVTLNGPNFQVDDDPQGVLADFLGFAASSTRPSTSEIFGQLVPGADGYVVPGVVGAYEIEDDGDIPSAFFGDDAFTPPGEPDWWVVWTQRAGRGRAYELVQGNELRHLFSTAASQWATAEGAGVAR